MVTYWSVLQQWFIYNKTVEISQAIWKSLNQLSRLLPTPSNKRI